MKRNFSIPVLVGLLGLCLLAFPPFIATLELHHQLGDADRDGHQHSDADLCSWVQSHASSSISDCTPVMVSQPAASTSLSPYSDLVVEHVLLVNLPARGPPSLSF
jgi:hypothetical protein